jgi:hypothetical protein
MRSPLKTVLEGRPSCAAWWHGALRVGGDGNSRDVRWGLKSALAYKLSGAGLVDIRTPFMRNLLTKVAKSVHNLGGPPLTIPPSSGCRQLDCRS